MNIVLVAGLFGFRELGIEGVASVSYFNGVARYLEAHVPGIRVMETETEPVGSIAQRSNVLQREIRRQLFADDQKPGPIHLIGHSIGGLAARHLVHDAPDIAANVSTVTGIGTPHQGSPVATAIAKIHWFDFLPGRLLRQKLVEVFRPQVVYELSKAGADEFNSKYPDLDSVRYFDVAGTGRSRGRSTSAFFAFTYPYLTVHSGPNDGIVPLSSATRGRPALAEWPGDHADLIGQNLDNLTRPVFDHLERYAELVRKLIA